MAAGAGRVRRGLHRREPRVLLALTALALAATAIPTGAWSPLRAILTVPLVLLLPGYALSSAIFRRRAPSWVERTALALSLSLVATALASLVLYLTPFELTLYSWAVALALVTAVATLVAAARRSPEPERTGPAPPRPGLQLSRRRVQVAVAVVAACLVAAAVALARTPLPSPAARGYTTLSLTRVSGSAGLVLRIHSKERRRTHYVLKLALPGGTTRRKLTLWPGQTWQRTLSQAQQAAASLYRAGHNGVYRFVRVDAGSTASAAP